MADFSDAASAAQAGAEAENIQGVSVQASPVGTDPANPTQGTAPVYSVNDFVRAARQVFGAAPECVRVALRKDGKESYTADDAKSIVKKFLKREVK